MSINAHWFVRDCLYLVYRKLSGKQITWIHIVDAKRGKFPDHSSHDFSVSFGHTAGLSRRQRSESTLSMSRNQLSAHGTRSSESALIVNV